MNLVEMIEDAATGANLPGWDAGPWLASWLERGSLVDWHGLDPAHLLMIATLKRCHELVALDGQSFNDAIRSMLDHLSPIDLCSDDQLSQPTTGIAHGCRSAEVRKAWAEVQLAIWEYIGEVSTRIFFAQIREQVFDTTTGHLG
jgi:hypothetical protein